MKFRAAAVAASVVALAVLAVMTDRAMAQATAASAGTCTAGQIEIWFGDGSGGGTAGTIYYPLEFSNIGQSSCTLSGIPKVLGVSSDDTQIGLASRGEKIGSEAAVTLTAGQTAHALIGIHDAGAVCGKGVSAAGLRVDLPGHSQGTFISFPFQTCATGSISMIAVEPIHAGTGIPGYTNS